jgi:hypothetical protein
VLCIIPLERPGNGTFLDSVRQISEEKTIYIMRDETEQIKAITSNKQL